jgi:hypothetical protein
MRKALICSALMGQFTAMDIEPLSTERRAEVLTKWHGLCDAVMCATF